MRTDKQFFKIFEAVPEWLFELAGLPSPGRSTLRTFTVKALERVADGLVVPEAPDQPLTVVEFQFQKDDTIYLRTVVEMAAVQEAHAGRAVQGVIYFGCNDLDPQTAPWSRVVRSSPIFITRASASLVEARAFSRSLAFLLSSIFGNCSKAARIRRARSSAARCRAAC